MTSAYRRSSAVVTRRAAVVERLRRVLFSPPKLIAVGALALAFAAGNAFAQENPIISLPGNQAPVGPLTPNNYRIDDGIDSITGQVVEGALDLTNAYHDFTSYEDSSIILNGNKLIVTDPMFNTLPDTATATMYYWASNNPTALTNNEQKLFGEYWYKQYQQYGIYRYNELKGFDINAINGGTIDVQGQATLAISPQVIDGVFTKWGDGILAIENSVSEFFVDSNANGVWDKDEVAVLDDKGNVKKELFVDVNQNGVWNDGENLTLGDNATLEQKRTYSGSTVFNSFLNVFGGQLMVSGDATYNNDVVVMGGALVAEGKQNFMKKVSASYGGDITLVGSEANPITVNDIVVDCAGDLWSFGQVNYNGNIKVKNYDENNDVSYAQAVFTNQIGRDLSSGRPMFGQNSLLTIDGIILNGSDNNHLLEAVVYANANSLDVDVLLKNQGVLTYTNVDTNPNDKSLPNQYFITLDENQTPTVLKWTSGSSNIANALKNNNLITKNITSSSADAQLYLTAMGVQTANQLGEANGYTVVFNNADGKKFDYAGITIVDNAFMVVQDDTNFGAHNTVGTSNFKVVGEAYSKVDDKTWRVHGSGMLGFDRDDNGLASSAPSITADVVEFRSGTVTWTKEQELQCYIKSYDRLVAEYQATTNEALTPEQNMLIVQKALKENLHIGGSRIWLDTSFNGNDNTINLGAINAKAIAFGDNTQIWYDGISAKSSDVKMTLNLNAPNIIIQQISDELELTYDAKGATNIDQKIVDERYATVGDIEDLFGAAVLVDATYAPVAAPVDATDLTEAQRRAQLATAGTVTVSAKNVGDYAAEQGMSGKEQELAQKLDGARVDGGQSSARFYDALYNETDGGKVRQTIHNLSLLGYTMLNSQGHFGNPTSSFFGGASLSGEAKRGQEFDPNVIDPEPEPSAIAKQVYNPKQSVWAAYTHTSVDGDDYDFGGVTMHGYELRRDGIIGGIRRQADATTSAGLFFGLSMPEVESRNALNAYGQIAGNGYGTVGSKMEMTDFQFAGHVDKVLADVWELSLYAGGGTQAMEWERDANLTNGGYYKYEADGSGNTLTGTIYLAYRANVNDSLVLRPTIGVDSEHSWLYGFAETATVEGQGGADNVLLDPYTDMFAQAYTYKKTYYNRNTARAGLSFAYSDPRNDLMGLNGRVFYGVKLGGDDAPELSYYSANYKWDNMESHEMGDSSLNVGGGGFMHLNSLKTLTATGDVNAIWYKNAQTFNVTGGVNYRF